MIRGRSESAPVPHWEQAPASSVSAPPRANVPCWGLYHSKRCIGASFAPTQQQQTRLVSDMWAAVITYCYWLALQSQHALVTQSYPSQLTACYIIWRMGICSIMSKSFCCNIKWYTSVAVRIYKHDMLAYKLGGYKPRWVRGKWECARSVKRNQQGRWECVLGVWEQISGFFPLVLLKFTPKRVKSEWISVWNFTSADSSGPASKSPASPPAHLFSLEDMVSVVAFQTDWACILPGSLGKTRWRAKRRNKTRAVKAWLCTTETADDKQVLN